MLFSVEDRYMMYYDLLLDVDLSGCRKQLQIKKGEVDSRTIRIELCRGTFPVVLDPKRHWAMIKGIKADKTVLVNPGKITNEGKIEYALGSQDAAAVGNSWYEVMVIDTDGENPRVLYSAQWKIEVGEELVEDGKITSTNEYGALTAAIKKIDDSIHVLARFSEGKKELSTSNGATAYEEVLNVKNNPGLQVLITNTNKKNLNAGYYTEKDGKKTLIASTDEVPYLIPYDSSDDSVGFWINGLGTIEITYAIVQRMTIDEYARYMFKEVSTKAEKLIEDGFMLEIEQGGEVVRINLKDYVRKINGKIDEQIQEMEKTKDSAIEQIDSTVNEAVSNVENAKNVAMSLFYFEEQDINTTNATPQYKVKAPLLKIKVSSSNIKINYYNKYYHFIDSQTFAGSIDEIIDLRQHADVEYISILTGTPSTAKIIWLGTAIAEIYIIEQEHLKYVVNKIAEFDQKRVDSIEEINSLTEAKSNDIATLTTAKMEDIANVTNAKLEDINNTASAQIESINTVANQNTKSGIEAVNAAARAQIGGIETVADAQKKGITQTAEGKIININNIATSQIDAINKTAQAQASAIEKQGNEIKQEGKEILDKIEKAGGANAIVPNAALIWNTNKSGTWNTHLTDSAEYPIKKIELRKSYNNTTTFTPSLDNPPQLGFNKKVTLYVLNKTSTNINDAVYSIPFEYDLNGCKFDNTNYYNTLTFDRERGQIRYYNIVRLIKFSELKGTKWKATKDEAKGWLKVQYDTFKDIYSSLNPTRNICNIAEQGEDEVGKYKIAEDNNTIILWLDLTRFASLQDWLDYIENNDVQLLTQMFNGTGTDISNNKELFEKFLKLQTYNLKTSFILDNKEIGVKEVTYAADIKTYIDNKIASIQKTTE